MACSRALVLACVLLLPGVPGCGDGGPEQTEPAGSSVSGDAGALRQVVERLARWEGTPLGRRSAEIAARLGDCRVFAAEAPGGDLRQLLEAIRCDDPEVEGGPEASAAGFEPGRIRFFLRLSEDLRLAGEMRLDPDGSLAIDAELRGAAAEGPLALAWPAEAPPGPPRLAGDEALARARLRPAGGLDLAALVPEGGQGDRLFRLKSDLFAGAVLDGAWEAAVYLPPEGHRMPLAALGLDVSRPGLAAAAMERFVADLEGTWSIQATPFAVSGHRGACLLRLNLMPELAPCYVATESQLVVGWNPPSVREALAEGPAPELGPEGGLVLRLDRFPEADRRLHEAHAPHTPPARIDYAWDRLELRGRSASDVLTLHVGLSTPSTADVSRRAPSPADAAGG